MKKRIITPLTPEQLADPTVMHIRLSDGAAKLHHVEDHPEFDVTCYPHTPDADYSVTLPDGYRADSWWVVMTMTRSATNTVTSCSPSACA